MRYRWFSDRLVGEILSKSWIDNAIPTIALAATLGVMIAIIPDYLSIGNLTDLSRQVAEFGLIAMALTIVILSGGIDLSVGSMFALCVLASRLRR